jgi:hypothetical protein
VNLVKTVMPSNISFLICEVEMMSSCVQSNLEAYFLTPLRQGCALISYESCSGVSVGLEVCACVCIYAVSLYVGIKTHRWVENPGECQNPGQLGLL